MAVPEVGPALTGIKEKKEESPAPEATWIGLNMFEHLLGGFSHLFIYLCVVWFSKTLLIFTCNMIKDVIDSTCTSYH